MGLGVFTLQYTLGFSAPNAGEAGGGADVTSSVGAARAQREP